MKKEYKIGLVLVGVILIFLLLKNNYEVFDYFKSIIEGLETTLMLFLIVLIFSIPLGLGVYLIGASNIGILKYIVKGYINLMRGTPLLLQLFFIFYGLPNIPVIGEYIAIKDRFIAGAFTFVLNYSAYFAEIFRGGFISLDKGQEEAAKALGLNENQTLFNVLLPQVFRVTLPSISNEVITLIKDTSLIFAIGVTELLAVSKTIVNNTANIFAYVIVAIIYLVISTILGNLLKELETKFEQ